MAGEQPSAADDAHPVDSAYECNGRFIDPVVYASGLRADRLPEEDAAAIAGAVDDGGGGGFIVDPGEWVVGAQTDAAITLLRPYDVEKGVDYELLSFERMDALPDTGDPGWMLTSSTTCSLRLSEAPLASADVVLDADRAPSTDSVRLELLVTERDCNSGQDAGDRVTLVSLQETQDAVIVRLAVSPSPGAHTCQSNPPTPFVVALEEPLGDRAVLDGSFVTPREMPVGRG